MARYTGLPESLRREVLERDNYRCRWCGATNRGGDLHHIEYRRGYQYDRANNLITLCRAHHSFVHGTPNRAGQTITKKVAQLVLQHLVEHPGTTGSAVWRSFKRRWALEGRCEAHAEKMDECLDCRPGWKGSTPVLAIYDEGTPEEKVVYYACAECGNDDPCEGYKYCSDCLEKLGHLADE